MRQVHAALGAAHRNGAAKAAPEPAASQQQSTLHVPETGRRNELFDRIDFNGNGGLSLAEIDKAVVELWPQFNHKQALMRAYRAADQNNDGYITRKEFGCLLESIKYFNELWCEACSCIRIASAVLVPLLISVVRYIRHAYKSGFQYIPRSLFCRHQGFV
jgi:hypothetical protein